MTVSPGSSVAANSAMTELVMSPAGTITHTARGAVSFAAISGTELTPVAPSPASASTTLGAWS
jgi:hypothetical protein